MAALHDSGERDDGIIALVKETADGLGQLVADHVKLARIEMTADVKGYVRDAAMLVFGGVVLAVGYVLGCVAAAAALARLIGMPLGFVIMAGVNIVVGVVALVSARRKMRRLQLMQETKVEVGRSMGVFSSNHALSEGSH